MKPAASAMAIVVAAAAAVLTGCAPTDATSDQQGRILELQRENEKLQAVVADQQKQICSLTALDDKRLDRLYGAERIVLGRYSGGVDLDGQAGHDGVRVYLKTIDRDGSVVKVSGSVKVQLYDLAAEQSDNLVGQHIWTPEQLSKHWSGGIMSSHFRLDCPWGAARPATDEITVRVQFTDYLTGKVLSAQKLCKIALAPEPSTQPADR